MGVPNTDPSVCAVDDNGQKSIIFKDDLGNAVAVSPSNPLPSEIIGGSTEVKQDAIIAAIGELATLTETQPVSAENLPLPTGASTEATQIENKALLQFLTEISLSDDKVHLLLQQIRDSIRMPVNYNEATNTTNITGSVVVSGNLTTVTTVSTVTNQTNLGGFSADLMVENNSRQDWGVTIRSLII